MFSHINVSYTKNVFDKSCKYSYILYKSFLITHLTRDTFLKEIDHALDPSSVELKFTECFSIYKTRKIVGFLLEARSNSKIAFKIKYVIMRCYVPQ